MCKVGGDHGRMIKWEGEEEKERKKEENVT